MSIITQIPLKRAKRPTRLITFPKLHSFFVGILYSKKWATETVDFAGRRSRKYGFRNHIRVSVDLGDALKVWELWVTHIVFYNLLSHFLPISSYHHPSNFLSWKLIGTRLVFGVSIDLKKYVKGFGRNYMLLILTSITLSHFSLYPRSFNFLPWNL